MRNILVVLGLLYPILGLAGETWISIPLASWHANRTNEDGEKYNQRNLGLGLEYAYRPDLRFVAGMYRNSVRTDSGYVGVAYLPLNYGPWRLGASLGVVSGYEEDVIPIVVPTVVYERSWWGVNILVVPETSQTKTAGAGIQLKFKLP